ncbi:hypothetical protein AK830_g10748 [Neonectria ditissima]|uniref:DJ-1/PfpI domain-containing protein n=1 Tax=Neonectria ditissima TaxID=78410 RepID=A0A0P7B2Z4_9HYPO|nr:hypothetical protein AK830_g10748 [Neonectria ditissima]
MTGLNLSNPGRPIHVGVILMNSVTEVLDVAPVDALHSLDTEFVNTLPDEGVPPHFKAQSLAIEIHWISQDGPEKHSRLTSGMSILPTHSFETAPKLDICLMGAHTGGYEPNETELAYVRKAFDECTAFLSICGGIDVPRMAGCLKGMTATGPRGLLGLFRAQTPDTNWVEKRWVRDGRLWSSGALLNGTDMMTNFVNHYWGGKDEETLGSFMMKFGGFPDRDVDYKDVPWAF